MATAAGVKRMLVNIMKDEKEGDTHEGAWGSIKFPEASDQLFTTQDDCWNNACLNWHWDKWMTYAEGYKSAADILTQQVESRASGALQDTLVYPIVFLYRQYVELALKALLQDGWRLQDIDQQIPLHHRIDSLWHECRAILRQISPGDSEKELDEITRLLKDFSKVDPTSMAFRYPHDTKGTPSLEGMTHINLRVLRETMGGIANMLGGAHSHIGEYLGYKADMEHDSGYY